MTTESHHTSEQVAAAFAKGPHILAELVTLGVPYPSLELYADASGTLWLGDDPTDLQITRATELVKSTRFTHIGSTLGISFCCTLVDHS
jgi:hypothetical protein